MKQVQINHEIQIRESDALTEYWRNRCLGYAQLCFNQKELIDQLTLQLKENEKNGD